MVPFYVAWLYYPEKRTIVTGLLNTSFGCGSGVFTYISSELINPDNIAPLPRDLNDEFYKPFPKNVAERFPIAL